MNLPAAHCGTKPAHFVRFYHEDANLLGEVAEFVDAALRCGGTAIVIATPAHLADLHRRLAGFGTPGDGRRYSGLLQVYDAEETLALFMIDGWPDAGRFADAVGRLVQTAAQSGGVVHAFGEMVAVLCGQGLYDAALQLEELWNALMGRANFSLFCAYPWKYFRTAELSAAFRQVCSAHDHSGPCDAPSAGGTDLPQRILELEQQAVALQTEVARRREAEQALAARERELAEFLNNAAEGIHRVDADGVILWANNAELKMLGYRWEDYIGQPIVDFHADRAAIDAILARLKAGETLHDVPARLRTRDGGILHVLISSNGCFEDGELRYTRCFTRDATAHFQRDAALAQLETAHAEKEALLVELTASNRAKDEFLAMLGHELRNPLSPIVSAVELMRLKGDGRTQKEQDVIRRQLSHMVRLVDDLLDISRVNSGIIRLDVEQVELGDVLGKAVEMVRPLMHQHGHVLSVDIAPAIILRGDMVRLAQTFSNLLTNAARYTPAGGRIRLTAVRDGAGHVCVCVEDNGIGIAADMLPRLFDLFFQGKRGIDRAEGGLGVGLALVQYIVGLHDGTVRAHSEGPGRGSVFTVRLPRCAGN